MKLSGELKRLLEKYDKALGLSEGYYGASSSTSLKSVIDMWQKSGDKLYSDDMPLMIPVRDLMPHREFKWTRSKARSGIARVGLKRVELSGPQKWDAMVADLKKNGWDRDEPLYFEIGRDGGQKVGEGNHRLAIADSIGIAKVPVVFMFKSGVVKKDRLESPVMIEPKAVKRTIDKALEKPLDPESEETLQYIMDLLRM